MFVRSVLAWLLVSLGWLNMLPMQAHAADMAEYRVLGYSSDGQYFAFEQFGVQDGSGFAYADVFVINLATDRWVAGSPIRHRAHDETERLIDVRAEAMARAEPLLGQLHISVPFRTLAATTPMEQGNQEETLAFYPRALLTPIDPLHTLTLNRIELESPRDCFNIAGTAGFELLLTVDSQGTSVVHRDERLPMSRPCPVRYGLAAVITPFNAASGRAVALISIYQLGFEGFDRRFLAVPFDLQF